jgi:hypothetical protein
VSDKATASWSTTIVDSTQRTIVNNKQEEQQTRGVMQKRAQLPYYLSQTEFMIERVKENGEELVGID